MMHVFYFFFEKIMHVLLREPNQLNLMSNPFFLESFNLAMAYAPDDSSLSLNYNDACVLFFL